MILVSRAVSMKQNAAINEGQQRLRKVEGRHHPLIKDLRRAFASNELTEDGCCAIEGMRVIEEAIRCVGILEK